jgi:hypothetical protein
MRFKMLCYTLGIGTITGGKNGKLLHDEKG